jgi:hypothetical protein
MTAAAVTARRHRFGLFRDSGKCERISVRRPRPGTTHPQSHERTCNSYWPGPFATLSISFTPLFTRTGRKGLELHLGKGLRTCRGKIPDVWVRCNIAQRQSQQLCGIYRSKMRISRVIQSRRRDRIGVNRVEHLRVRLLREWLMASNLNSKSGSRRRDGPTSRARAVYSRVP